MRGSLAALFGDGFQFGPDKYGLTMSDGTGFFCRHFAPERIERTLGFFRETLLARSDDDVRLAFSRWEAAGL